MKTTLTAGLRAGGTAVFDKPCIPEWLEPENAL